MIIYKKTDEWNIEWKRVIASGTTSDNEWQRVVQRMTTIDNKLQRVTANVNEWYNKLKQMTANENKHYRLIICFKMKQRANLVPEEFYSIFMQRITTKYSAI